MFFDIEHPPLLPRIKEEKFLLLLGEKEPVEIACSSGFLQPIAWSSSCRLMTDNRRAGPNGSGGCLAAADSV